MTSPSSRVFSEGRGQFPKADVSTSARTHAAGRMNEQQPEKRSKKLVQS